MRSTILTYILLSIIIDSYAQNVKGFYVNSFNTILGNASREDSLLLFAKNNNFNYLTLYDIHLVNVATPLTNTATSQPLAAFIKKAKTTYSITQIGVAGETFDFFKNIVHVYNSQHPAANEKVDVYNFEFEFWIAASVSTGAYYCTNYLQPASLSCDTAGAFKFYKRALFRVDSLANTTGQISEAYFGFFNPGQAKQIVATGVDRVLLSIYLPTSNYSQSYQYGYVKPRLEALATASTTIKVIPIYSAEPSFMNSWINLNQYFSPYSALNSSLVSETATWKMFIQLEGIQWFAYSFIPKRNMDVSVFDASVADKSFAVFPNPVPPDINFITLNLKEVSSITITDLNGKALFSQPYSQCVETINVSDFKPGVYFITTKDLKNNMKAQKLIVE